MYSKLIAIFELPPADPVAHALPLLGSPWPVTFIISIYLLFVLKFGRTFMKHRQPYNLKNIMIAYNLCQVICNAILFSSGIYSIFIHSIYDLRCMETLSLDNPNKNIERFISYAFFLNKILDLLDTIFFVLRKSHKQITLLHVYHHASIILIIYWVVRFYGLGGQFCLLGTYNTLVHTIMYYYYLVSVSNMGLKSNLWWKKYITIIQIIQFTLMLLQSIWVLIFNPGCKFPLFLQFLHLSQAIIFLVMFSKFYIKSYVKPPHEKQ